MSYVLARRKRQTEAAAAVAAERNRMAEIRKLCAEHQVPALIADEFIFRDWTREAVVSEILDSKRTGDLRTAILRVMDRSIGSVSVHRLQQVLAKASFAVRGNKYVLQGGEAIARELSEDFANALVALSHLRQIQFKAYGLTTDVLPGPKFPNPHRRGSL